jgi:hypothetical protein
MSQLHEFKVKGIGSDLYLKATSSPRAGTRNAKTKRKTAHALGHDFQDTRPWKDRHSDIASTKSQKQKGLKKAAKLAAETMKGDAKKA